MFVCFAFSNLQSHIPKHIVCIWFNFSLRRSNLFNFKDVLISLILIGLFPKLLLEESDFNYHSASILQMPLLRLFFFFFLLNVLFWMPSLFSITPPQKSDCSQNISKHQHTGELWQLLSPEILSRNLIPLINSYSK